MRKNIAFLLLLLIMPLCFAGCGEKLGETYWIDSSKAIKEYFVSEQYLEVKNVEFDKDLQGLMVQDYGKPYAELSTVYSILFNSSISYAETYYVLLQNNPQVNNKEFKNKIIQVNKKLKAFKSDVERFIKCKSTYETYMDFTDKETAESPLEQKRLIQFKQDYLDLIESAHALSMSLLDASRVGYYDFNIEQESSSDLLTQSNIKIAVYLTNSELLETSIDMLELYNYIDEYDGYSKYWNNSINFYNDVLKPYEKNTLTKVEDINGALSKWKVYYDAYLQDKELFYDIKNEINFERLLELEHNASKYAEATNKPADKNKIEYFMNFSSIASNLVNYTSALFA